jgi:hypothetical protein
MSEMLRVSVLVFTDVGEEIDDELMLFYLMSQGQIPMTITTVFVDRASLEHWNRNFRSDAESHLHVQNTITFISYHEFQRSFGKSDRFDFVLQACPLKGHSNPVKINVTHLYILQGNIDRAKLSFNMGWEMCQDGSLVSDMEPILLDYAKQRKLIQVSSDHCSTMRPSIQLIHCFPQSFQLGIWFVGFKLCIGRVDPHRQGVRVFAEGLVNSEVGRGSNYTAVKNLYEAVTQDEFEMLEGYRCIQIKQGASGDDVEADICSQLACKYFSDLYQCTRESGNISTALKDMGMHSASLDCLTRMNRALAVVFPGIWTHRQEVLYSNFTFDSTDDTTLLGYFETYNGYPAHAIISSCNPVYDLFAAHVLLRYITRDKSGSVDVTSSTCPEEMSVDLFLDEVCALLGSSGGCDEDHWHHDGDV